MLRRGSYGLLNPLNRRGRPRTHLRGEARLAFRAKLAAARAEGERRAAELDALREAAERELAATRDALPSLDELAAMIADRMGEPE